MCVTSQLCSVRLSCVQWLDAWGQGLTSPASTAPEVCKVTLRVLEHQSLSRAEGVPQDKEPRCRRRGWPQAVGGTGTLAAAEG